jgi:2-phospho-L-lactate guanylyltransferase
MTYWAIVPVKSLRAGKSRLSGVLTDEERTGLNSYLLEHTLKTLKATPEIEQTLVVSRDPAALALAQAHQARIVQEGGSPQLNLALSQATRVVQPFAPSGLIIIPADLPLITPQDIQGMLKFAQNRTDSPLAPDQPVVVIAPDRHRLGTNGLLICPPGIIAYEFGPGSFELHCQRARSANARLEIYENPAFALDVDLPEDLDLIREELAGLDLKNFRLLD